MTNGTISGLVGDINAQKAVTGIQAEANGNNVTLFGENIQTVTIGYDSATVVTQGLTSAVNAVGANTDDRTITIAAADVIEGRTFNVKSATTGKVIDVSYTVAAGDTHVEVAKALVASMRADATEGADMRNPAASRRDRRWSWRDYFEGLWCWQLR